jgi:MinD-like ATPase involved in chromosome partitioning or flagellar assembly
MLTACWSVKGGSGTTVVTAMLAVAAARAGRAVVAADLAGDLPFALGVAEPAGPGLRDWLDAGVDVPADALVRLAHETSHGITLLTRGAGRGINVDAVAGTRLAESLRAVRAGDPVFADCGNASGADEAAQQLVAAADRSLLVLRPCYLALRRAQCAPRPTAVVLVDEPGRCLTFRDIEDVLGVPVVMRINWDSAIAHAVDRGLLSGRVPRRLERALREVAA